MILFITRKYPPSVGGMQNLSYRLTTGVSKHVAARIISWGGSQRWLPFFLISASLRALIALSRDDVTLIHIGDPVLAPLGIALRILRQVPMVVNAHGLDVTFRFPPYQAVIPACLRRMDRVICISTYTREQCLQRGVPAERCVVIPLGIEIGDYAAALPAGERQIRLASWGVNSSQDKVLLTVGRLVVRKGLAPFVSEALPRLMAKRQDWVYLIIGDGPERGDIESAVQSQGLGERVKLLGRVNREALRAAYALADLFVMPNVPTPGDPEGFGLVTLEARAAGVPVVAADLEGIGETIAEQDGTLVRPGDWPAFASSIRSWLDRQETVADRERRRQRLQAEFAWSRIIERYLQVFQEVTEEHNTRRGAPIADRY
jgi:glycosyltransferase involved in cell wall biosynthesis